jgi:protein-ribulosamine 3-kinase
MFNTGDQQQLFESILFQTFGETVPVEEYRFVSGGCINNTVCLITEKGKLFIKWHESAPENMFEVEAMGLDLLKKAGQIKIPTFLGKGNANGKDYLIMEYIDSARPDKMYWENFGANLAHMHKNNTQNQYGLDHNNYIGRLPQSNEPKDDWIDFFVEKRLEVQVQLARYNGLVDAGFVKKFQKIYDKLPELLPVDPPSLIHGDMWSGNVMTGADGQACDICKD